MARKARVLSLSRCAEHCLWSLEWWGSLDAEILKTFFTTEFWGRRLSGGLSGPFNLRSDLKLVRMIIKLQLQQVYYSSVVPERNLKVLVSRETAVLLWWGREKRLFGISIELILVKNTIGIIRLQSWPSIQDYALSSSTVRKLPFPVNTWQSFCYFSFCYR